MTEKHREGAFQCPDTEHRHSLHRQVLGAWQRIVPCCCFPCSQAEIPPPAPLSSPRATCSSALWLQTRQGQSLSCSVSVHFAVQHSFFPRPGLGTVQLSNNKDLISQLTRIHQLLGTPLCTSKCHIIKGL